MDKVLTEGYYEFERTHWWFVVRSGIIHDLVKRKIWKGEPLKILNVGCATGRTSEILGSFGQVQSVEYDEDLYQVCVNKLKIDIVQASITELPFEDASFDLVCAFDVIEHVEQDQKAVEEMNRVCKSGGYLFITVPAYMSLWSMHDILNQHYRRYLPSSLFPLFSRLSGNVIHLTFFNSLLFPFIFIARKFRNLIESEKPGSETRSDLEMVGNKWVNRILGCIFSLERRILRKLTFPFGVSISLIWKKG